MSRPRLVVVGSSNTDMVVRSPRLPAPGETVLGGEFAMAAGGKGANQAVAAARLGALVTLVARLGRDPFGDAAEAGLASEGIDLSHLSRHPEAVSGVALILVDAGGENLISVAPGANATLDAAAVEAAAGAIRRADALLLQLEVPLAAVARAAELAFEAGVPVLLDPAPARPLPDELLARVAYLTPNVGEAEALTGVAADSEGGAREAAERLLARGARRVVVTRGAAGALLCSPGSALALPAPRADAVDTTAAGDAFSGALAVALASGQEETEAVRFANRVAAVAVTRLGAQPSLPWRRELAGSDG